MVKKILLILLILSFCAGCGQISEQKAVAVKGEDDLNGKAANNTEITVRQKEGMDGNQPPDIVVEQKGRNGGSIQFNTVVIISVDEERCIVANRDHAEQLYSVSLSNVTLMDESGESIQSKELLPGQLAKMTFTGGDETGSPVVIQGDIELELLGDTDEEALETGRSALKSD